MIAKLTLFWAAIRPVVIAMAVIVMFLVGFVVVLYGCGRSGLEGV